MHLLLELPLEPPSIVWALTAPSSGVGMLPGLGFRVEGSGGFRV